ncbi:MAG: hypothetical protein ABIJ10_00890 [Candidatus Micrarchaeota archaeon]|nr:hypothetical protein [Candidatus Micrarchaeota archaeon]MBU1886686.1 hypothetical protein [Candidatus Micrarchaeota archaeon]
MASSQKELGMKTTKIDVNGRKAIVGILKRYESTPLIDAPFAVKKFNEENGTNLLLIRPTTADFLFVKTDQWVKVNGAFPSPVGMAIAYESPNKKIGDSIVLADCEEPRLILVTTGAARGEMNAAVLVPDITADDIKRDNWDYVIEVPENRLIVVPDFPALIGTYRTYEDTTIPSNSEKATGERKFLWRRENEKYVGLVVRLDGSYNNKHDIVANGRAFRKYGVAVEVPDADVAKI